MNLNKRFDYNDPKNFMMDNYTMGTSDYYKAKFHDKLPFEVCEELELKSRKEYDEDDLKEFYKRVQQYKQDQHYKIMKEFLDRENEGLDEINDGLEINKISDNDNEEK